MGPMDVKGRTILDSESITMVSLVLSTLRKNMNHEGMLTNTKDLHEVLDALCIAGYAIVAQGSLDNLKNQMIVIAEGRTATPFITWKDGFSR